MARQTGASSARPASSASHGMGTRGCPVAHATARSTSSTMRPFPPARWHAWMCFSSSSGSTAGQEACSAVRAVLQGAGRCALDAPAVHSMPIIPSMPIPTCEEQNRHASRVAGADEGRVGEV
jgi:hypothetical protein